MKTLRRSLHSRWQTLGYGLLALALLIGFYLFRLGSLVPLSASEKAVGSTAFGWHGIWHDPLNLPLNLVRSVWFKIFSFHSALVIRLPNVIFALLAILSLLMLLYLWHSLRIALLASALFACNSWSLHVGRLASYDVQYLWATPALLLSYVLLQRYAKRGWLVASCLIVLVFLLYVPGLVWFIGLCLWLNRQALRGVWQRFSKWWQRLGIIFLSLVWLPLLIHDFIRVPSQLWLWLGIPLSGFRVAGYLKHIAGVGLHLFIRGPAIPSLWLGHLPLLDIFSLAMCLLGIYFYGRHITARRSRLLLCYLILGTLLSAWANVLSLSFLTPLLFIAVASGLAYFLHTWLETFPINPIARSFGLVVMIVAVAISCAYNLRAYYVAWPHAKATTAVFDQSD